MTTDTTPLASLVRDALACVAAECPAASREMRAALGDRVVHLDVSTEAFAVALTEEPAAHASISVRTTAAVLHRIFEGDRDPLEAILDDEVVVRGAAADLEALSRAALFFVKGAVRCRSMDPLLNRLKELSDDAGEQR